MPMSDKFRANLLPRLRDIAGHFGTPFHIYHQGDIEKTCDRLTGVLQEAGDDGAKNFFAVKATPNSRILDIVAGKGMGFDCSSIPELRLARETGVGADRIMFTSNNTSAEEFDEALGHGGCVLNLDDISLVDRVPQPFPELICFRYNPGSRRKGNRIIGNPSSCKYGLTHEQIAKAYRLAKQRGAKRFGLHTMVVSNQRNWRSFVETAKMVLDLVWSISTDLNIEFDFINIGGGLGIPYRPEDNPVDLDKLRLGVARALRSFKRLMGWAPALYMECGRFVTGPNAVLVTTCINRMSKYEEFAGVDAAAISALMRPPMYYPKGGYHHVSIHHPIGAEVTGGLAPISIVGPACEDNDRFAWERSLPPIRIGDKVIVHDTGAHCMGNNYNGRLRPQELLLNNQGEIELIRRAETINDLLATQIFDKQTIWTGYNLLALHMARA